MDTDKKLEKIWILDILGILLFIGVIIGVFYLSGSLFNSEDDFYDKEGNKIDNKQIREDIKAYEKELKEQEKRKKIDDSNKFINIKTLDEEENKKVIDNNLNQTKKENIFSKIISKIKFWDNDKVIINETVQPQYSIVRNYEEINSQIIPLGTYVISGNILFFSQYDKRFLTFDNLECEECVNIQIRLSIDRKGEKYIILKETQDNVYEIPQGIDISYFDNLIIYNIRKNNAIGYGVLT